MPLLGSRGAASTTGFGALANLGYFLRNSLRFRASNSAYLSRTPGSAGNRQVFTLSAWVKRGSLGVSDCALFGAQTDANNRLYFRFESNDTLNLYFNVSGTAYDSATSMVFRDPSAWYHIVIAIDTTQATNTNRIKVYVNGAQQTLGTYSAPPQNTSTQWNNTVAQYISKKDTASNFFDGYIAELNAIDGQALTPSSFGKTDAATNQWVPKKYAGTYGTNGFYLPFTNTTSTSTLGNDFSGNGNTWTVNNISLTAGSTYDSMTDVPTLTNATTANYCVMNPVLGGNGYSVTNANLTWTRTGAAGGANDRTGIGTVGVTSGKWYWEFEVGPTLGLNNAISVGMGTAATSTQSYGGQASTYIYDSSGVKYNAGSSSSYGAAWSANDVIGIAFDADTGSLTFYRNNTSQGVAATGLTSGPYFPVVTESVGGGGNTGVARNMTFGQRPFSYTPPSGFKALNTYNLP